MAQEHDGEVGVLLFHRFQATGRLGDLWDSLEILRQAALSESSPTQKRRLLGVLGQALTRHYEMTHDLDGLERAVSALSFALDQASAASEEWSNLAGLLSLTYSLAVREGGEGRIRLGGIGRALNEMYTLAAKAWDLTTEDSKDAPTRAWILGRARLTRGCESIKTTDADTRHLVVADLDNAVKLFAQSLAGSGDAELTANAALDLAYSLVILAYLRKVDHTEAIESALRSAAKSSVESGRPDLILAASQALAIWYGDRGLWSEAASSYNQATSILVTLLMQEESARSREWWIGRAQGLASNAAFCLARCGRPEAAIEVLESLRGWFLEDRPSRQAGAAKTAAICEDRNVAVVYVGATPWGAYSVTMTPRPAGAPFAAAKFVSALTTKEVDELLGMNSGALNAGSRPGERTGWQLLDDFLSDVAPSGAEEPYPGAFEEIFDNLHRHFGIQRGRYLTGYFGVIDSSPRPRETSEESVERLDQTLRSTIAALGPLAQVIEGDLAASGTKDVVIAPDGKFSLLPLHAALLPSGRLLADQYNIWIANSIGLCADSSESSTTSRPHDQSVIVANTDGSLPFSELEAEWIAEVIGAGEILVQGNATSTRVRRSLKRSTLAHFACHGLFVSDDPLASRVVVADGSITAAEIMEEGLFSGLQLVVFSACQSAVSDFKQMPDELVGLPATILHSGAASYVGALWPVDDLATSIFFKAFYEARAHSGASVAESLRQARQRTRTTTCREVSRAMAGTHGDNPGVRVWLERQEPDSQPFESPLHWAAFAQFGLPSKVDPKGNA